MQDEHTRGWAVDVEPSYNVPFLIHVSQTSWSLFLKTTFPFFGTLVIFQHDFFDFYACLWAAAAPAINLWNHIGIGSCRHIRTAAGFTNFQEIFGRERWKELPLRISSEIQKYNCGCGFTLSRCCQDKWPKCRCLWSLPPRAPNLNFQNHAVFKKNLFADRSHIFFSVRIAACFL